MRTTVGKLFVDLRVVREGALYALYRGEKALATPRGHPYALPTKALAEAVAGEWRAQKEKIVPLTMPMTQLAATAIDIVGKDRERIVRQIVAYAATELLCHRADDPEDLVHRQQEDWQPLLDWYAVRFGALLREASGVMPVEQTAEAVTALHGAVAAMDDFVLAGLSAAVDASGSLVLGLALLEGERDADAVFKAAELDTRFQAVKWGVDPAMQARMDGVRREIEACERWFGLVRG